MNEDGLRETIRLLVAVCRAVHYAHQRGFLHRDLKPANVLVDTAGVPHVTDFGLAKRIGESVADGQLTEAGRLVGTLAYMAPEQTSGGERLTTAADVYSIGAILFLTLTGRPLRLDPVAELMGGGFGRTPPAFDRTVDRDLGAICQKCLVREPTERFGSAEALADELDRWVDGRPIQTRPPRLTRRAWLWVRRRPWAAATVGVAVLLLALGVGLVTWKWRDEAVARRLTQIDASRSAAAVARSLMEPEADGDSRELGSAALWWVQAFEQSPVDEVELRHTARTNLAALSTRLHTLRDVRRGEPPRNRTPVAVESPGRHRRALATGSSVQVFEGEIPLGEPLLHDDVVRAMAFSDDGKRLITAGDDHLARVWESTTDGWVGLAQLEHQDYVRAVAYSPDGRLVATGGADGAVQLWESETGLRVGQLLPHSGWVERVAFSVDGCELVTTSADGEEKVWALSAASRPRADQIRLLNSAAFSIASTADGNTVYVGTKDGLHQLNAATQSRPEPLLPEGETWAVGVHPRGDWVAAGGPSGQKGWFGLFRPDGGVIAKFELPHPVRSLAVHPDGHRVMIASAETTAGGVWMWDMAALTKPPRPLDVGDPNWSVVFTPDGTRFASTSGHGRIRSRQIDTPAVGDFTLAHPPRAVALAFAMEGHQLASAGTDGSVRVWEVASGTEVWAASHRGAVWAVAASPNGRRLASGGRDRCVRLWDANTGDAVGPPFVHRAVVWAVAFSPDEKWVWTGSEDGTVRRRLTPQQTPNVPDDQLRRWAERATGLTLASSDARPRLSPRNQR